MLTSNDVRGLKGVIAKAKEEKEGSQKISADAADLVVYIQKKLFHLIILIKKETVSL
jgi:hypothetical protein